MRPIDRKQGRGQRYGLMLCTAAVFFSAAASAAGFMTTARDAEGRWWLVDGAGNRTLEMGVGWVSPRGPRNTVTGKHPYWETVKAKYAAPGAWEAATVARLKAWGFNTLGSDSTRTTWHRGLRHTILLRMGAAPATWKRDPDDYICPHLGGPCSAFPNVFSPKFPDFCREVAEKACRPYANDRDLVGYFIDNELAWWGLREKGGKLVTVRDGTTLVDAVAALPSAHSARRALEAFLAARGISGGIPEQVKVDFLAVIADRYFSATTAAIRAADPNHLVMGCRFAGLYGAHPVVWEAAGRHCDVVTVNIYPTVHFGRNGAVTVRRAADGKNYDMCAVLTELQARAGKPVVVTEWSFPAKDSGLPCTKGAGQRLAIQAERENAAETFVRKVLSLPFVVGYDFFMWTDMPHPGTTGYAGENCNYGLVNAADVPYARLTEMFARVQAEGNRLHVPDAWTVTVDGKPIRLHRQEIRTMPRNEPSAVAQLKGGWMQFGSFTWRRPVEVRVRSTRSLANLAVVPAKFGVKPQRVSENAVRFTAEGPFRLSFESNGRHGALHLFADAVDPALPDPKAPDVIYFGPGEHERPVIGVGSGQTLFLDEGAIVYGHLAVTGSNATVCGPGMLSGARLERFKGPGSCFAEITRATNVTVRGVTFTCPNKWTLGIRESAGVTVDGVRLMCGNMVNDDGIDVVNSRDVTIRRSFIHTQDDNICLKGMVDPTARFSPPVENVRVEDCELWCDQANTFRIGFECDAARMKGLTVRNVDVLHFSPIVRPVAELWSHAIFKIQTADGLVFSGLDAEGMRIHSDGTDVNLVIAEPRPTRVGRGGKRFYYTRGGAIRDCRFADIAVDGVKGDFTGTIYLKGRTSEENVENIRFSDIRYFGERLEATSPQVKVGPFAECRFE